MWRQRYSLKKGYQRTTTREVGALAGLGTGSMYYYLSSKEEIVKELIGRYWTDLSQAYNVVRSSTNSAESRLAGLIQASMAVSHQYIEEDAILHQDWLAHKDIEPNLIKWMDQLKHEWISTISEGIEEASFKTDTDPTLVYRMIMGAISWYRPSGQYPIDDIARSQASVLLSGIRREAHHE